MLDATDLKILNELARNGRASFASLGALVGLSRTGRPIGCDASNGLA